MEIWIGIFTSLAVILSAVFLWYRIRRNTGSLCYLEENNKRWLLVGISLHTVISPALRKLIKPKLEQLWQSLNSSNNIGTQLYPHHMKSYVATFLNYESINNNRAFGLKQQAKFNYKVKNSVDLSKLFLETKMAQYSDFDETCDLSALLRILEKTGICSPSAKQYAEELRQKVRNTWAHCDYTKWDETKYTESLEIIDNLVKNMGLSALEERHFLTDLEKWRRNGKEFIKGRSNVMAEVTIQVQNLIRYAELIVADNPEMINNLKEQLVIAEKTLINHEQRIEKLEHKSLIHEHERQIIFKGKSELIETKLKKWKEDDKTVVATMGVKSILKCVEANKCVTITGSSGMGKTATLRHIVLQMADKGYYIIPVNEPRDIEQYYRAQRKTMFIVDDFCGTFSANNVDIEKWKTFIDQSFMHLHNNVKLVVACRFQVFNDKLFQTLSVFKTCVCNLMSNEFKSSDIELQSIASMYLESEADKVAEYVNLYHCFPLLCKLYKTNPSLELAQFFQNPFSVYETEIDMLAAGHNRKYCALLLCVVFNNALEESLLTGTIDKETRNIFRNVFEVCKLNRETSRILLMDELDTLLMTFLQKEEGCYKTVHDKMFDFLSFYFGKNKLTCQCLIQNARSKFIAERFSIFRTQPGHEFIINLDTSLHNMYMKRLMRDWQNGDVVNVFINTNMMNKTFRQTFLETVKCCNEQLQQKMADTCDKETRCTALHVCCIYDDMDLLTWCFNHRIDVNKCATKYGVSPLFVACVEGHVDAVNVLLDRGADINKCRTDIGASPLCAACQNGHTETVTVLLDRGADINKCTTDIGASPLYVACQNGHTETVTVLLDRGADINKCTTDIGASPLYVACGQGHKEIVTVLLDRGADINKCTTGIGASPLHAACENGHTATVIVLLDRGADINKCTTNAGASPLHAACENGHTATVIVLLDRGADINKCTTCIFGYSPLHIACENGHTETVTVLVDRGADINKVCTDIGVSPLIIASQKGHTETVIVSLDRGVDINKGTTKDRASPLHVACQNGHTATVIVLLDRGADINKCTTNAGASPLYAACENGHTATVIVLLDRGADINRCRTDNGASPLYIACQEGHTGTVTVLLDRGADINRCITDVGVSPLYVACQQGQIEMVIVLLDRGADINKCRTDVGASPLYIACQNGHTGTVTVLLDRGADINNYRTEESPLHVACYFGYSDIVQLLLCMGANSQMTTVDGRYPVDVARERNHNDIVSMFQT